MLDLGIVKKDFSSLVGNVHPWMLSHFVMWLDIKVAEYKVYGHMVLDDTPNDTPSWLRGSTGHDTTEPSNENDSHNKSLQQDMSSQTSPEAKVILSSENTVPTLTRYPMVRRLQEDSAEPKQTTVTGGRISYGTYDSRQHSDINVQPQEQWSDENESIDYSGHTETGSRSTIVLTDMREHQINIDQINTPDSVHNSSICIDPDIIKIEVSSDDEITELEYLEENKQTDSAQCSYSTAESQSIDIQNTAVEFSKFMPTLMNAKKRQASENKSSWRSKKWDYFERLPRSQKSNYDGARVHSRSIQDKLMFPKPFPLTDLKYGPRALDMISTGVITRPGKMQFLDTVFTEIVKYTGLYDITEYILAIKYPTPQQKLEVAEAICTTFPKLDAVNNPEQGSTIIQWLNILKDKFRNERRMLHHGPYLSRQRFPGSQYSATNSGTNSTMGMDSIS